MEYDYGIDGTRVSAKKVRLRLLLEQVSDTGGLYKLYDVIIERELG